MRTYVSCVSSKYVAMPRCHPLLAPVVPTQELVTTAKAKERVLTKPLRKAESGKKKGLRVTAEGVCFQNSPMLMDPF